MLSQGDQEKLVGDIFRSSYEAATLEDLGSQVLPLLDRLLDTSTSLLYRCNERRELVAIAGTLMEGHYVYAEHYYAIDPLQRALQRLNPRIFRASAVPEWKEYQDHPAHTECSTHFDFDNFAHLRLNDGGMHDPGMVGIVLARNYRQPDFNELEGIFLARLLPALQALTRRSARLETRTRTQPYFESMLEAGARPKLALDPRGELLWASRRAESLLGLNRGGRKAVPDALVKSARQLGTLVGKKPANRAPAASLALPRPEAPPLRLELRLARTRDGTYFVIAEIEDSEISPQLAEIEARHRLTAAETQVLRWIALGLSDRDISRRLFVSTATVHSHVTRILGKLGVGSRVQAALLAHGHPVESDSDESFPKK